MLPGEDLLLFLRFTFMAPLLLVFYIQRRSWFDILEAENQLRNFRWEDTTCCCCATNHVDKEGNSVPCDKEILTDCIHKWFGNDFDHIVRNEVRKAFIAEVARIPFGYLWLVAAGTHVWWYHLDLSISRGANAPYFFSVLVLTIPWHLWLTPSFISIAFRLQTKGSCCRQIFGCCVFVLIVILAHFYSYVCWAAFSEVLGYAVFTITTFPVCVGMLWRFARSRRDLES